MRLVTYRSGEETRLGALVGSDVLDLSSATGGRVPADCIAFLEAGNTAFSAAAEAIHNPNPSHSLAREAVKLLAPIPNPRKIICLGLNYADHAAETGAALPKEPMIFAKFPNTVTGPYDDILLPRVSESIDWEAELGVVIGRRGKHIPQADAMGYVAGYLVINDVSVRDYQRKTTQFVFGKSFDTHCPMGPALVTADEVIDPHNLDIQCSIDGEVLQQSNTRHLIFSVPVIISYLSQGMTLEPGDVIATGTPPGVGLGRNPQRWIRPGQRVRTEIQGLGFIENLAVAET